MKALFTFADSVDEAMMLVGSICAFITAGLMIAFREFYARLIDESSTPSGGANVLDKVATLCWQLTVVGVATGVASLIQSILWRRSLQRQMRKMRSELFRSLLKRPVSFFDLQTPAELQNALSAKAKAVSLRLNDQPGALIFHTFAVLMGYGWGFARIWGLTLMWIGALPVTAALLYFVSSGANLYVVRAMAVQAEAQSFVSEVLHNVRIVQCFNRQRRTLAKFASMTHRYLKLSGNSEHATLGSRGIGLFAGYAVYAAGLFLGLALRQAGYATAGTVIAGTVNFNNVVLSVISANDCIKDMSLANGAMLEILKLIQGETKEAEEIVLKTLKAADDSADVGVADQETASTAEGATKDSRASTEPSSNGEATAPSAGGPFAVSSEAHRGVWIDNPAAVGGTLSASPSVLSSNPSTTSLRPQQAGQGADTSTHASTRFRIPTILENVYKITFEDVRFQYPTAAEDTRGSAADVFCLHGMTAEVGRPVAFTGPSGSGKSTSAALLMKFYAPSQGRILLHYHNPQTSDVGDSALITAAPSEQEDGVAIGHQDTPRAQTHLTHVLSETSSGFISSAEPIPTSPSAEDQTLRHQRQQQNTPALSAFASGVGLNTSIGSSTNFIDLKEIPDDLWYDYITYVPQEPQLFRKTIRENLRIAVPAATDEDVEKACKAAHLHDTIVSLPNGYDTICDGTTGLSGG